MQISTLKTWFVIIILTFKNSLMQLFWTFKLSLYILATVLATLPNIGRFFQSSGHSARRHCCGLAWHLSYKTFYMCNALS
jgi:hypothetical protein